MSDLKSVSAGVQVPAATPTDYVVLPSYVPPIGAIFSTDFEDYNLGELPTVPQENGFIWRWHDTRYVHVSDDNAYSGSKSVKFIFNGTWPDNANRTELYFNFGPDNETPVIYIKFRLYIPNGNESYGGAAYTRPPGVHVNHKLLRFYSFVDGVSYYGQGEGMGSSTRPRQSTVSPDTNVSFDYAIEDNSIIAYENYAGQILSEADRGKWIDLQFAYKLSSALGAADGWAKWYKNGVKMAEHTGISNWHEDRIHRWTSGYMFGAANDGYIEQTIFFVDNFAISTEFIN